MHLGLHLWPVGAVAALHARLIAGNVDIPGRAVVRLEAGRHRAVYRALGLGLQKEAVCLVRVLLCYKAHAHS